MDRKSTINGLAALRMAIGVGPGRDRRASGKLSGGRGR